MGRSCDLCTLLEGLVGFDADSGRNGIDKRQLGPARKRGRRARDREVIPELPERRIEFEFDHTSVRLCQSCLRNLLPEWMIETGRTRRRGPFEF